MRQVNVAMEEGGSSSLFYLSPAVSSAKMLSNMRSAIARGLPLATLCKPHGHTLSIVGGGPSIADTYKQLTGYVATVNGSLRWLLDQCENVPEIDSLICGICDAGPHIAGMIDVHPEVRYYVASICDPAVFDKLQGCDVRLWHVTPNSTEDAAGVEAVLDEAGGEWHAIGGGCTMGLRWVDLGYYLGFRKFALHGLDSCFRTDSTHAYPDRADGKEWVEFAGRRTRLNFLAQAYDFAELLERLWTQDTNIEIEMFGDGIIQDEWKAFRAANPQAFTPMSERTPDEGALRWPHGDLHAAHIVTGCYSLADAIKPYIRRHAIAVQAGGNVGVLPKLLARDFGCVHTFEPDAVNFSCLMHNVTESNIVAHCAALGSSSGYVGISRRVDNCGQSHVAGEGTTPVMTVDSMQFTACDLIVLDVEGYELAALKGAQVTIGKFCPVIVIEENGLSERYGVGPAETVDWLVDTFGYGVVGMHGRDLILTAQ